MPNSAKSHEADHVLELAVGSSACGRAIEQLRTLRDAALAAAPAFIPEIDVALDQLRMVSRQLDELRARAPNAAHNKRAAESMRRTYSERVKAKRCVTSGCNELALQGRTRCSHHHVAVKATNLVRRREALAEAEAQFQREHGRLP